MSTSSIKEYPSSSAEERSLLGIQLGCVSSHVVENGSSSGPSPSTESDIMLQWPSDSRGTTASSQPSADSTSNDATNYSLLGINCNEGSGSCTMGANENLQLRFILSSVYGKEHLMSLDVLRHVFLLNYEEAAATLGLKVAAFRRINIKVYLCSSCFLGILIFSTLGRTIFELGQTDAYGHYRRERNISRYS